MTIVMGIDLSLTAPAACVIPARWDCKNWRVLKTIFVEHPKYSEDKDVMTGERLDWISLRLGNFAFAQKVDHVFIEGYAFGSQNSREAMGEIGGAVKLEFMKRFALPLRPIPSMTARKTLLGKVPGKKSLNGVKLKDHVNHMLAKMGATFETMDEGDAFVVANHGRRLLGMRYIGQ